MKKQITAAILGCGSRGALFCELMLAMDGAYKITALCDVFESQIKKTQKLCSVYDA